MLKLIAAVDRQWGIGCGQELLFHIPEDLEWFKEHTLGKTVLLGRKTLESFPGGRPLPHRTHLLLSRTMQKESAQIISCSSVEKALDYAARETEVWVIGGAQIYRVFLPYCEEALITQVDAVGDADQFLPNLDQLADWTRQETTPWRHSGALSFRFCRYVRIHTPVPQR